MVIRDIVRMIIIIIVIIIRMSKSFCLGFVVFFEGFFVKNLLFFGRILIKGIICFFFDFILRILLKDSLFSVVMLVSYVFIVFYLE